MLRQFAFHDNVSKTAPKCLMFELYNRLENGETLTNEEKERVIDSFYGTFGQHYGATYKQGGWMADFSPFLKRILVKEKYSGWKEYRSFNKSILRKVLGSHNCLEMVEIK